MPTGGAERATRRRWALAALASLLLLAAGLVLVVVESRDRLLELLVAITLSAAALAATGWWAFTTRRVWKRWLNVAIAALAALNVLLALVDFGIAQAAGALAVVLGALAYVATARRALQPAGSLPTGIGTADTTPPPGLGTTADAPSSARLRSPTGGLDTGGGGSRVPARPWLLVNPRSGGGKAARFGLVEAARERGVEVHLLAPGDDPVALARQAVAAGADAVGVAGGDGSLGLVAAVAVEADVPFVCVPAGTRNHFAGDLGLDRADPRVALDAFAGRERRVDVGVVGGRVFVNNVSLGAYADLVADPRYRDGKLATAHELLPASLRGERALLQVQLRDADGREHPDVLVLLVASNCYELNGVRERLDAGVLQVSALGARTGAAFAGLAARALARGGRLARGSSWTQWTTTSLRVEAPGPQVPAGIDGEAATLVPPLEFRVLPQALRVLVPPTLAAPTSRLRLHSWKTVRRLLQVAFSPSA